MMALALLSACAAPRQPNSSGQGILIQGGGGTSYYDARTLLVPSSNGENYRVGIFYMGALDHQMVALVGVAAQRSTTDNPFSPTSTLYQAEAGLRWYVPLDSSLRPFLVGTFFLGMVNTISAGWDPAYGGTLGAGVSWSLSSEFMLEISAIGQALVNESSDGLSLDAELTSLMLLFGLGWSF